MRSAHRGSMKGDGEGVSENSAETTGRESRRGRRR
ncbi:hypothetical protein STAFG_8815 [Streptomyces afghaniensis 772]|uniref:Uncharacterized protein n=1 Tax=Streptomyces afghaniensis 772 TaxID=1283301 RepID=S4N939_9ACTN|nr:hypothetical protein STAFG_8815 [Streptomyces afghaniensis 772]